MGIKTAEKKQKKTKTGVKQLMLLNIHRFVKLGNSKPQHMI